VSRVDRGALIGLLGVLVLWIGQGTTLTRYLRPGMRPWLMCAGAGLVLVGAVGAWMGRRREGHTHRAALVGWLLLVPVCVVAVMRPGPLGSYAASRQTTIRTFSAGSLDLAQTLRAGSFAGQTPELRLVELFAASQDAHDRALLVDRPVRLTGFVTREGAARPFLLTRFFLGCCAGDALAVRIRMTGWHGTVPATDTWVVVEGELVRSTPRDQSTQVPTVRISRLRVIDEPDEPYELPR
jgi:uncharacterized repeat protein (TIGR03943 family)